MVQVVIRVVVVAEIMITIPVDKVVVRAINYMAVWVEAAASVGILASSWRQRASVAEVGCRPTGQPRRSRVLVFCRASTNNSCVQLGYLLHKVILAWNYEGWPWAERLGVWGVSGIWLRGMV